MKVIIKDKKSRYNISDTLLCSDIVSDYYGKIIIDMMNEKFSNTEDEFILVDDTCRLYIYDPEQNCREHY